MYFSALSCKKGAGIPVGPPREREGSKNVCASGTLLVGVYSDCSAIEIVSGITPDPCGGMDQRMGAILVHTPFDAADSRVGVGVHRAELAGTDRTREPDGKIQERRSVRGLNGCLGPGRGFKTGVASQVRVVARHHGLEFHGRAVLGRPFSKDPPEFGGFTLVAQNHAHRVRECRQDQTIHHMSVCVLENRIHLYTPFKFIVHKKTADFQPSIGYEPFGTKLLVLSGHIQIG
jgi:hypothetical protein